MDKTKQEIQEVLERAFDSVSNGHVDRATIQAMKAQTLATLAVAEQLAFLNIKLDELTGHPMNKPALRVTTNQVK